MKKLFGFSLALLFFTACVKDSPTQEVEAKQQTPPSPYAVSVEDAVQNLNDVMGPATRADGTRAVIDLSRITVVGGKQFGATTRTADGEALPDSLIYIIPFEGEGCAVVAADARLTPVYAILDQTQLTPEDFEQTYDSNTELSEQEDLQAMLIDGIKNEMIGEILNPPIKFNPAIPGGGYQRGNDDGNTRLGYDKIINQTQVDPLLKTQWDQGAPYNDRCFIGNIPTNDHAPAGCVAIATGQLMVHYHKPNPCVVNGETFSWSLIAQCTTPWVTVTPEAWNETARFVHAIGQAVDMNWGSGASGAPSSNAAALLRKSGFSAAKLYNSYDLSKIKAMLQQQKPVYIEGWESKADGHGGHTWLIDGCNIYTTQHWLRSYLSDNPHGPCSDVMMSEEQTALVNCNFGWGGWCDGEYSSKLFDTDNGNYVQEFKMITY